MESATKQKYIFIGFKLKAPLQRGEGAWVQDYALETDYKTEKYMVTFCG